MNIEDLRFDADGLLPVVVQDAGSGAVLMLAYANREAVEKTLASGQGGSVARPACRAIGRGPTKGREAPITKLARLAFSF